MGEMVERVAKAILAELRAERHGYVGSFGDDSDGDPFVRDGIAEATVDGHFDLMAVARAAIAAMRRPTEAMVDAGMPLCGPSLTDPGAAQIFDVMIDEALKP